MGEMSFRLVQTVPGVEIKDGFVLVSGEGWGLCCTPHILRAFCEQGSDYLDRWEAGLHEPILLFAERH